MCSIPITFLLSWHEMVGISHVQSQLYMSTILSFMWATVVINKLVTEIRNQSTGGSDERPGPTGVSALWSQYEPVDLCVATGRGIPNHS
jgi:hypothetical protein